jgi:hypothetical protein
VNPALWLLIGLQTRGWLRYLGRNVRTVKGALLALVGLFVFVPWLLSLLLAAHAGIGFAPEIRLYGPAALLLYCLLNVLLSSGERAIYFSPAEVNFLFPGPFGRRQLLAYKIGSGLLVSIPYTLFLTLLLRVHSPSFLSAFVGLLLMFTFMQLFGMALNLTALTVGARLYTRGRKLVLAGAVLLAVVVAWQAGGSPGGRDWRGLFDRAVQTPAWRVVSRPLGWFFEAFLAPRPWPDLVEYALLGTLVNGVMLAMVFALDAQYLEAAAASSARLYALRQRLRGRTVEGGESARDRKVRLAVPDLPWWGGIGPILWRQLTAALRGLGRLVVVLIILGVLLVGPVVSLTTQGGETALTPALAGTVIWATIFVTPLVPFDFRGDVDRLGVLKTLPLPAWRLTVGQLLTPVLVTSVLQWLVLAAVLAAAPQGWPWVLGCAAYAPPFNFLLFALENLLFLWSPTRLQAATPGDFQALGRNVILLFAKGMALSLVALVAAAVGVVTWVLTGGSLFGAPARSGNLAAALAAPWPVVALGGAALVPAVAFAFTMFDVGRDTPP